MDGITPTDAVKPPGPVLSDAERRAETLLDNAAYAFRGDLHDAWRSTLPRNPDGRFERRHARAVLYPQSNIGQDIANSDFQDLHVDAKMLCNASAEFLMHLMHDRLRGGGTIDNTLVYDLMTGLYTQYTLTTHSLDFLYQMQQADYPHPVPDSLRYDVEDVITQANSYAGLAPELKEIDRRIAVAGLATLAERTYRWCVWEELLPDLEGIVAQPGAQAAIADGKAILASVREAKPYDQNQGFAREVVYWNK